MNIQSMDILLVNKKGGNLLMGLDKRAIHEIKSVST
jgi:hypothetical protein